MNPLPAQQNPIVFPETVLGRSGCLAARADHLVEVLQGSGGKHAESTGSLGGGAVSV